jgi:hypothetical protein
MADLSPCSSPGEPIDRDEFLETPELGIAGNQPGFAGDGEGCGETVCVGGHGLLAIGCDQGDGKLIDDAHCRVPSGLPTGSLECVEHLPYCKMRGNIELDMRKYNRDLCR